MDQPSIVPLLAAGSHAIFGDFVLGFRLLPALVMSATVALTAEFTHSLGGDRFAQWLAGACVLLSPVFLIHGVLFSTDLFQALTWLGLSWVLVRLNQTGDERWWLAFGAIAGFSLNTKYLVAFLPGCPGGGIARDPSSVKSLSKPWLYLGVLLATPSWWRRTCFGNKHTTGPCLLELGVLASGGKQNLGNVAAFCVFSPQQIVCPHWSSCGTHMVSADFGPCVSRPKTCRWRARFRLPG